MGTYNPGAFGPFNGKIGHVVAARWKKLKVVKNVPSKSTKPPTLSQLEQRSVFGMVTRFTGIAAKLISIGFPSVSSPHSPINVAVRDILKRAVIGTYPDFKLDYEKVRLSKAVKMNPTLKPKIVAEAGATVKVSWAIDPNAGFGTNATDRACIFIYNPTEDSGLTSWEGLTRSNLSADFGLPYSYVGTLIHCWIFFVSKDGKFASQTDHVGSVTILE